MVFELKNYETKEFIVKCRTGVTASSVSGKIIPVDKYGATIDLEDPKYRNLRKKVHTVNKATLEPYYTRVYNARKGYVEMNVVRADWLGKKGLNWKSVYKAEIDFNTYKLHEEGESTLEYWLGKEMDETLLIHKSDFKVPTGSKLGIVVGIKDYSAFYEKDTSVKDIFKAYASGKFYGKTGLREIGIKTLPFGVEIEFTGMERKIAAEYMADFFDTTVTRPVITNYDRYLVKDKKGRKWYIKSDSSIKNPVDYYKRPAVDTYKCELETPILEYEDIETLQNLIRGLREDRYMVVNSSCGIHVHVGGKYTPVAMKNIYNLIASHQKLLRKALKINIGRLCRYCSYVDGSAYRHCKNSEIDMDVIKKNWYETEDSRYRIVNFESFFKSKGVEFRCFNSTTHAGKVKAYIQFSLALCSYAMNVESVRATEKELDHDLSRMRNWLHVLGLAGEEFATCRYHMTKYLKDKKKVADTDAA